MSTGKAVTTEKKDAVLKIAQTQKPTTIVVETPKDEAIKIEVVAPSIIAEEQKEKIFAQIEKFKPEAVKTAEGRIESMNQFSALSARFKMLKEKSNDLKLFEAGNDKTGAKMTLLNQQGFLFEIQNTNVLEKLIFCAKEELNILLRECENEILTFDI